MHFETAGSLSGGRRVWGLATLPDRVQVGGDPVKPYVLLMNSHDSSTALIAATTPIRVIRAAGSQRVISRWDSHLPAPQTAITACADRAD